MVTSADCTIFLSPSVAPFSHVTTHSTAHCAWVEFFPLHWVCTITGHRDHCILTNIQPLACACSIIRVNLICAFYVYITVMSSLCCAFYLQLQPLCTSVGYCLLLLLMCTPPCSHSLYVFFWVILLHGILPFQSLCIIHTVLIIQPQTFYQ